MIIEDVYEWTATPKQRILDGINGRGIMSSTNIYTNHGLITVSDIFPHIDTQYLGNYDALLYNQLSAIEDYICKLYLKKYKIESYVHVVTGLTKLKNVVILDEVRNMHLDPKDIEAHCYIKNIGAKGGNRADIQSQLDAMSKTDFIVGDWL